MKFISFIVPGEPRGKGRPRFNRATGKAYTDSETGAYEHKIAAYYKKEAKGFMFQKDVFLVVEIHAYLPIPKSASKQKSDAMARGEILPSRKPDIDNIIKAVMDALNNVAYTDDARVVQVTGRKCYGTFPCVSVVIREV